MKVKAAEGTRDLVDAGDDLVRIVTKLTSDLERFDALLLLHRRMLEQGSAGQGGPGATQLTRQSERLSHEAAGMMASVQQALAQLRELSHETRSASRG